MSEESRNKEERIPIPQAKTIDRVAFKNLIQALETTPDSPDLYNLTLEFLDGLSPEDIAKTHVLISNSAFSGTINLVNKSKPSKIHSNAFGVIEMLRIPLPDNTVLSPPFEKLAPELEYLDSSTIGYIVNILKSTIDSAAIDAMPKRLRIFSLANFLANIVLKEINQNLNQLSSELIIQAIPILHIVMRALQSKASEQIVIPPIVVQTANNLLNFDISEQPLSIQQPFITMKHKYINVISHRPRAFGFQEDQIANLLIKLLLEVSTSSFTQFYEIFNDLPQTLAKFKIDQPGIQNLHNLIQFMINRSGIYSDESSLYAKFILQILKSQPLLANEYAYICYSLSILHSVDLKLYERLKIFPTLFSRIKPNMLQNDSIIQFASNVIYDFIIELLDSLDQLKTVEFEIIDIQHVSDLQITGEAFIKYIEFTKLAIKISDPQSTQTQELQFPGKIQEFNAYIQAMSRSIEFIHKFGENFQIISKKFQSPIITTDKDKKLTQEIWQQTIQFSKKCEKVQQAYNMMIQTFIQKILEPIPKGLQKSIWDSYFTTIFNRSSIPKFDSNLATTVVSNPEIFANFFLSFCSTINMIRSGSNIIKILKFTQKMLDTFTAIQKPAQKPGVPKLIPKFLSLIKNYSLTYSTYIYSIKVIQSLFKFMSSLGIENRFITSDKVVFDLLSPILSFRGISVSVLDFILYCGSLAPSFYSHPIITDVVLFSLNTSTEKAIQILGEIHKHHPKQFQRPEVASALMTSLVSNLTNVHGDTKNIALKLIRNNYPLTEISDDFKFPESASLIELHKGKNIIPIDSHNFLMATLKALLDNPENELAQNLLIDSTTSFFTVENFTNNMREQLADLFIHTYAALRSNTAVFEKVCLGILKNFPDDPTVHAHVLTGSYQSQVFTTIQKIIASKLDSTDKFTRFTNELVLIYDLKYYNFSTVFRMILKFIRNEIPSENIDVYSYISLIAAIAPDLVKDEPNMCNKQTNLQEINVLRSWICKSVIHCREIYSRNPQSTKKIINNIMNSGNFIVTSIFAEVLYDAVVNPDIKQSIEDAIDACLDDANSAKNIRNLGILLRISPSQIKEFQPQLTKLIQKFDFQNNMQTALLFLPPLIESKLFDIPIQIPQIFKYIEMNAGIFRLPATQIMQSLYPQHSQQIDALITQQWDKLIQPFDLIVKAPFVVPASLHHLVELFVDIIPEKLAKILIAILQNSVQNTKTPINDSTGQMDIIGYLSVVIKQLTTSNSIFKYLKSSNTLKSAFQAIATAYTGISLLPSIQNNGYIASFIRRASEEAFDYLLTEKDSNFITMIYLIIDDKKLKNFQNLIVTRSEQIISMFLNYPEIVSIVSRSLGSIVCESYDKVLLNIIKMEIKNITANFGSFSTMTFKSIAQHFALSDLKTFLEIASLVFEAKNSYLINTILIIFNQIVKDENFNKIVFMDYQIPQSIAKNFIYNISIAFAKVYPGLVDEYIQKMLTNTGIYIAARFASLLVEKKFTISGLEFLIFDFYSKAVTELDKIACIALWARAPPTLRFLEIFTEYLSLLRVINTIESNEIYKSLKIPKEIDCSDVIKALTESAALSRGNYKITWTHLQIIANNLEYFKPHMQQLYHFLIEIALIFSSIRHLQRLHHYFRYNTPITTILTECSTLPKEKRGIMARYTIQILQFAFDVIGQNQEYFRLFGAEGFPSIERLYKCFELPSYFPDNMFETLKKMYARISQYNQQQMAQLNQMQLMQRQAEFQTFETYLGSLTNILKNVLGSQTFKLNEGIPSFFVELSGHSSTSIWNTACFGLMNACHFPGVTEKLIDQWPSMKERQPEHVFNVIWGAKGNGSGRSGVMIKYLSNIIETVEWYNFPSFYASLSTMLLTVLSRPAENTVSTLMSIIESSLDDLSNLKKRSIVMLLSQYLLLSNAKHSRAAFSLFNNEKFFKEFFMNVPSYVIKQIPMADLQRTIVQNIDSLENSLLKIPQEIIDFHINNQLSAAAFVSKFIANITDSSRKDAFGIVRYLEKNDLGLILRHSLTEHDCDDSFFVTVRRGLNTVVNYLGEWNDTDFTKNGDIADSNKLIIEEPLINLRHFYFDRALSGIPSFPDVAQEVCTETLKYQELPVFKVAMDYLWGDGTLQGIAQSTKGLSKKLSELVTPDNLDEYLIFRDLRRLSKSASKLNLFEFWFKPKTGSSLHLQSRYNTIRENIISIASNVSQSNNIYKADSILRRKFTKTLLSHISADAKQLRTSDMSASSMINFILSQHVKNNEEIKLLQNLIQKSLTANPSSDAAFMAFYNIIDKLNDVEIKDILTTAPIPFTWNNVFVEKLAKQQNPGQYVQFIHPAFKFMFSRYGIQIIDEFSSATISVIDNISSLIDNSNILEHEDEDMSGQLIGRWITQNSYAPMYEYHDAKIFKVTISTESSSVVVSILLNNGKKLNYLVTKSRVCEPTTAVFAHCISKVMNQSPGSLSRKQKLIKVDSIDIGNDLFMSLTNASKLFTEEVDGKEKAGFTSSKEYFDWSMLFASRLAALNAVHYARNKSIDYKNALFDKKSASIISPSFNTEEPFVIQFPEVTNLIISSIGALGPFRAGFIAASDAIMQKMAKFMALGVTLFDDSDESAKESEQRISSVSLRKANTSSEIIEMQKKVNALIQAANIV